MMHLAAVTLAQEGGDGAIAVAHGAGWVLEHAWLFPLIPAVSFFLILFVGKRLRFKGAEIGILALSACFVLSLVAGWQWIHHVDDSTSGHGAATEHAIAPAASATSVATSGPALQVRPGGESAAGLAPAALAQTPTTATDGTGGPAGTDADPGAERGEPGGAETVAAEEHSVAPVQKTVTWFEWGDTKFEVGILVDGLSVMMLFVVSLISLLVHVYSTDYVHGDVRYTHFFAFLSLFTASMLMLIMSASILQFLTSWELVGLCSYVLIGHWWEERSNSDAANKAFITNRVGDMGLIIGFIILMFTAGGGRTFNILDISSAAASGAVSHTALLVASLCLIAAVMSKSGQVVLHTWLPDAMAGPTPVSALIHAATMVVAGIFMVARLYPVFFEGLSIAGSSWNLLAIIGGATTLVGGSMAFVQRDIKKVLAYSTVSQLGYMVLGLGVGAWTGALFHLFTHAFFKACLFLGAGSVSHACNHSFDMKSDMGGLRKYMPKTFWTFLVASAALAGIPLFSGFWSKDEVLAGTGGLGLVDGANGSYHIVLIMGLVTAVMTAAYMTRCVYLTFFGEYRGGGVAAHGAHDAVPAAAAVPVGAGAHGAVAMHAPAGGHGGAGAHAAGHGGHDAHGGHGHGEPHESGPRITVPLIVLATLAFVTMFANIPDWFSFFPESWRLRFEHFVEPKGAYFVHDLAHAGFSPALALISLVLALLGIGLAGWYYFVKVYRYDPAATELPNGLTSRSRLARLGYRVLENRYYLDWLYTDVIVAFTKGALARAANWFNQEVIDGAVNGVGKGSRAAAHVTYDYLDQKVVDGVVNGSGIVSNESGGILRRIQTGRIQQYAALLFAGAAILAGILVIAI